MSKFFYSRLALTNIKKNSKTYIPYIITCILTVSMYYIIESLSLNEGLEKIYGSSAVISTLSMGSDIVAIFSVIFLFYTNSFLIKKRKKEFGLYNILGMEKKHIFRVIAMESLFITVISLAAGFLLGIILDKLMFLIIIKLLGSDIPLGFYVSTKAINGTIVIFVIIFAILLLNSLRLIHIAKPIELLKGGNVGEKEPKTKIIMTILGILCLGGGYYISLTVKDPVLSLTLLFVAVILVIVGTYFLFTAGSIALLKLLRKNKNYYYKTKHFTSISGMMYRMKQNSVGLANICILSTMVLVMISTTTSLMVGINDLLDARYPYDFNIQITSPSEDSIDKVQNIVDNFVEKENIDITTRVSYTNLMFAALKDNDNILLPEEKNISDMNNIIYVSIITLDDYNKLTGENKMLNDNEVFVFSTRVQYNYPNINFPNSKYKVAGTVDKFATDGFMTATIYDDLGIVVKDRAEIEKLYQMQKNHYSDHYSLITSNYSINVDADNSTQCNLFNSLSDTIHTEENYQNIFGSKKIDEVDDIQSLLTKCKAEQRNSITSLYGGLFFLGVFLGTLFIIATILIIYYKQVSEGYDDKDRFQIMQNVGMSHSEVKKSIHSQILTVFFLPLIVAGVHIAFAFPIMSNILAMLGLVNNSLYIMCTIACFLIFTIIYGIIYSLTAKTYYKIVGKKNS